MHTHHSHSGQFCGHATDDLEAVIRHAVQEKRMTTVALTEHISREDAHLYEAEREEKISPEDLTRLFEDYVKEATRLKGIWNGHVQNGRKVTILFGFEGEWIHSDAEAAASHIRKIIAAYPAGTFDYFLGSIHHVNEEPIDYDQGGYIRARAKSSPPTEEGLFAAYFDQQYAMLQHLKPRIVSHFDLIRLKSDEPNRDWRSMPEIFERIVRNLTFVKAYGGLLEVNTSALRKGLEDPYPRAEILAYWKGIEGHVVLSDDSHGISQVAACYKQALSCLEGLGWERIHYLDRDDGGSIVERSMTMDEVKQHPFWH